MNPFDFRPDENDPSGFLDWNDNRLSNAMAYISVTMLPRWCQSPEHWTARFADHFWAECSCCLFFRGIFIGIAIGAVLAGLGAFIMIGA